MSLSTSGMCRCCLVVAAVAALVARSGAGANGQSSARIDEAELPRKPSVAKPQRPTPIITFLQSGWTVEEAIQHGRRLGANHVWIGPNTSNGDCEQLKAGGLTPVMITNPAGASGPPLRPTEWIYAYVKTPWHEKGPGELVIDLLQVHDRERLRLCPDIDPRLAVRLQVKSSLQTLASDAWTADLQLGRATVHGGVIGEHYRAVFLVRFMTVGHWTLARNGRSRYTDGYVPSVRARHIHRVRALLQQHPAVEVMRPTSLLYFFVHLPGRHPVTGEPTSLANCSVGYWLGTSPERMVRFEKRFGYPFDPFWITDNGYGDAGYIPTPGYRDWMRLIRDDVGQYAKELNDLYRSHGKRIRWFWGDGWTGVEPYLGDVDRAGFDEVVKSMDAKHSTVRQLMDFESRAKRIARFPWVDLTRESTKAGLRQFSIETAKNWRWLKREMLFACPHGLTFGGSVSGAFARGGGNALVRVAEDFRTVHRHTCARRVFTHDISVYVLNTWGRIRAWQKPVHYMTQQMLQHPLVDWPVNIKWLSFDEVIADGVPEDAAVLIVGGSPGTSFAGGPYWRNESLCRAVREFIHEGGGLLAMGGATVTDGRFALEDVLGVRYGGPSCELARRELWNANRRVDAGYYDHEAVATFGDLPRVKVTMNTTDMPADIATRIRKTELNLVCDSWTTPTSATRMAAPEAGEKTGIFLRQHGSGRVVYIGGYAWLQRVYKVLVFYLAGRVDSLDRLDTDNANISTYFYPDRSLLIVYNSAASPQQCRLRFDPTLAGCGQADRVHLKAQEDGAASRTVSASALREGIEITLESGQACYWRIAPTAP